MRASLIIFAMLLCIFSLAMVQKKPIRLVVIDTGVNIVNDMNTYSIKGEPDKHGHGTSMVSYILFGDLAKKKDYICTNVHIEVCKFYKSDAESGAGMTKCLKSIKSADIVNISAGGYNFDEAEYKEIDRLTNKGTRIVTAAGNDGHNLAEIPYYPAGYKFMELPNMYVVGNGYSASNRALSSNYKSRDMVWINSQDTMAYNFMGKTINVRGTSSSAALYTHKLIKEMCND